MNYQEIKEKISKRDVEIRNIDINNKEKLQSLLQEMQKDHQYIVTKESSSNNEEKKKYRMLRKEMENQNKQLNTRIQLVYKRKANQYSSKPPVLKNILAAFFVGGLICSLGQVILNGFTIKGFTDTEAAAITSIIMIFLGALLTGLGVYDRIGKFAGAGSMVPITGFANSIVSPALEFKREGFVYGVGAKIFTNAGPVLLYGTLVSSIIGLIFYLNI